jgi:predicted butyrate kinase (DUF1464 family)
MRAIGIDPGTGSFDFFGMDDQQILIDESVQVQTIAENPVVLLEYIRKLLPLDVIVGPSGYGLPVISIKDMDERQLNLMVPDDKSIPLYDGIRMVLRLMKSEGLPVVFTPGVIHLPTVPVFRKANKLDMGTADKICCTALAIKDQSEYFGIPYDKTSFILTEIGYAFTATIAVENGKIVDGLGGTSGGPGFISLGCMDSELAARLGKFPGALLFSGGAKDASGKDDLTSEEMALYPERFSSSWNILMEGVRKNVAAMKTTVEEPREILISGRLSRIPEIAERLIANLSKFGKVRAVRRKANIAKEAAEGAFILAEGLMGGRYQQIVDFLQLRQAEGTMFDYILVKEPKSFING